MTWFKGGGAHLARQNPVGAQLAVSGRVERYFGELQMAHPDYLLAASRLKEIPTDEAVYPATAGLPPRTVRRLAHEAFERAPELPEWLDPTWLMREGWSPWRIALAELHAPKSDDDFSLLSRHRRRLAYDELFAHQLAMAQRKEPSGRPSPRRAIASGALAEAAEGSPALPA